MGYWKDILLCSRYPKVLVPFKWKPRPRPSTSTDNALGRGGPAGKVNDGQITNCGGPARQSSSHITGSAVLSQPPAAREQRTWRSDHPVQLAAGDPNSKPSRKLFLNAFKKKIWGWECSSVEQDPGFKLEHYKKSKVQEKEASILHYKMKT